MSRRVKWGGRYQGNASDRALAPSARREYRYLLQMYNINFV
jgi:hypothetical protein